MTNPAMNKNQQLFSSAVGRDISIARGDARPGGGAEWSGETLAALLNHNRDWTSKLERGLFMVSLYDYLQVMDTLRATVDADHPALALHSYIQRRKAAAAARLGSVAPTED